MARAGQLLERRVASSPLFRIMPASVDLVSGRCYERLVEPDLRWRLASVAVSVETPQPTRVPASWPLLSPANGRL